MSATEPTQPPADVDEPEAPGRPWAAGIGFVLLGLGLAAGANALAMEAGGAAALAGWGLGLALGLLVAGSGVHRVLWAFPTRRTRGARLLLTALVTPLVFVALMILASVVLTVTHQRFR